MRMLPAMTSEGLLPPGRHAGDLSDLHQRFVVDAPEAHHRSHLWVIFNAFVECVKLSLPGATLWVNGGFVTHKAWAAPGDVDVLLVVDGGVLATADHGQVLGLTTLLDVECVPHLGGFAQIPRMQPFGGWIDSFIAVRGDQVTESYWDGEWSSVKGQDGNKIKDAIKGYVEVQL